MVILSDKNFVGLEKLIDELYKINSQNQHEFSILFGLYIINLGKEEPKEDQRLKTYLFKMRDTM